MFKKFSFNDVSSISILNLYRSYFKFPLGRQADIFSLVDIQNY